jgi:hypothetical protein
MKAPDTIDIILEKTLCAFAEPGALKSAALVGAGRQNP